uniref:Sulfatase N-terminal domain-containing protein n=1 Tax=Clastoptera arizonana TaxID=38151 RepID=A0A1B6C2X0_9HEMI
MIRVSFIHLIPLLLFLNINFYSTCNLKPRLNILLIIIDDLRPALGCYGDTRAYTPNIDELSKEGILFKQAFVQQALCAPSRNSFLTSRRPDTLHLYDFYSYWRETVGNFSTIPQVLKINGFKTMSIGKVFHPGISSNWSDDQPYSWSFTPFHPSTEIYKEAKVCVDKQGKLGRNLICPVVPQFQPKGTLPDIQSVIEAKRFLNNVDKEEPFFLAVGFHKPHVPLKYPFSFLDYHPFINISLPENRFQPFGLPHVAWNPWTDVRNRNDIQNLNISFPFGVIPDKWNKLIRQSYYASVSYIDDLIGKLVSKLKEQNLFDNTIIAIIGDHGWSLSEHGEWSKFSTYETAVQVPFILRIPGITSNTYKDINQGPGLTSDVLVELVDLFPTLIDLVNLDPIPLCPENNVDVELCTEGVSLLPVIQNLSRGGKQDIN